MTLASQLAAWVSRLRYEDLPQDVIDATKLRILDVLGLALAGIETRFGRSIRAGAVAISPPGPSRIVGSGDKVGLTTAAFANASFPQALEFDDTHNESIVHMSSPSVAAALALAETRAITGRRGCARPVPPARLSSHWPLLSIRYRVWRGQTAGTRCPGAGVCGRNVR
jgi:2-methylcitrate dehydratase PrpD